MGWFSLSHTRTPVYGAVLEIGSGSVLVAIVHSDPRQSHPGIIWSHREHAPLKNIDSLEQSAKAVMTALLNAVMLLDTTGRQALHEHHPHGRLQHLQVSIAAPWSYTVSKTINYDQSDTFTITRELIQELIDTAEKRIDEELQANQTASELGLAIITEATLDTRANGYSVAQPEGNTAASMSITQASVVAQKHLIDAVAEQQEKVVPQSSLRQLSVILLLYAMSDELLPSSPDRCLVDITYEATEIGIVRDGTLRYCTHTPYGAFSLAREISGITNAPLHESFGHLHSNQPFAFLEQLPKQQRSEVEAVCAAYSKRVHELFLETGDQLAIPKHIAIHTDHTSEPTFRQLIENAGKQTLKRSPHITLVGSELVRQAAQQRPASDAPSDTDSALLLAARFFHTHHDSLAFTYH